MLLLAPITKPRAKPLFRAVLFVILSVVATSSHALSVCGIDDNSANDSDPAVGTISFYCTRLNDPHGFGGEASGTVVVVNSYNYHSIVFSGNVDSDFGWHIGISDPYTIGPWTGPGYNTVSLSGEFPVNTPSAVHRTIEAGSGASTGPDSSVGVDHDIKIESFFSISQTVIGPFGGPGIHFLGINFFGAEEGITVRGVIAVIPEPQTYMMMLGGMALLGAMAGRRKSA